MASKRLTPPGHFDIINRPAMEPDAQLELFESPPQAPDRRGMPAPMRSVHLRPDHAVLLMIIGLIGSAVVFAAGVERGKRLVRAERLLLSPAVPSQAPVATRKTVVSRPRFAIQVASYSQPKFAKLALQRLQQQGEQAFVMNKQDRMVVLIGPFSTKGQASAKLTDVRRSYQGCFVRTL